MIIHQFYYHQNPAPSAMKTIYVIGVDFSNGDIRIFFLQFKVILEGNILDAGYQRNRAFLGQNWEKPITFTLVPENWKLLKDKLTIRFSFWCLTKLRTKLKYKTENEKLTMWLLVCCLKEPVLTKSRTRSRPRSWRGDQSKSFEKKQTNRNQTL